MVTLTLILHFFRFHNSCRFSVRLSCAFSVGCALISKLKILRENEVCKVFFVSFFLDGSSFNGLKKLPGFYKLPMSLLKKMEARTKLEENPLL